MSRSTDAVIRLMKSGGKLSVNCDGRSTEGVIRIINTAKSSKNVVTLRNLDNHSTDAVIRIIKACGDSIFLEV